MKYSKSILSLVTILALNSSIMADPNGEYVPLTNATNDNAWIMFGVNGFADGVATAASDGVFTAGYSKVSEASVSDDLASPSTAVIAAAASGTIFEDSTGSKNMATFQALKDSAGAAYFTTSVDMALKTSDLTYSETQPVRTMYIAIQTSATDTNTIAKIKLDYKANLEGRTAEIQLGGAGAVYTVTISETSTFDNPGIAKETVTTNSNPLLQKPEDTLAYDLAAAPMIASSYNKATHQGTATGGERFYNYDAANGVWKLWDRAKVTAGSNTLTTFEKGKSYWGRIDINGDSNVTSTTPAGLYLGKTGLTTADASVYTGKLTAGAWNMLAFDPAAHQDIRNATTGIVLAQNALADGDAITVVDETGVNSVLVTFPTATDYPNAQTVAQRINTQIEAAKLLGKIPKSFNVKAFRLDAAGKLVLLSDKKFTIKDTTGDVIAGAKTLANQDVVDSVTGLVTTIADVNATGATSRYGEYAMLVEPLVGVGSAAELDNNVSGTGSPLSAEVQFGNIDGDSLNGASTATPLGLAPSNTTTTMTTATTALTADDVFDGTKSTGRALEIDTNFDGTSDMLLVAADKSFYIKDHTYTRVYTLDTTTSGTTITTGTLPSYQVKNTVSATITPANNTTVADFVTDINAKADTNTPATDTQVYASDDGSGKLVVVTTDSSLMDLLDANDATRDYFTKASSTADIAKGAIKQVINVSELARQGVITTKKQLTFTADAGAAETDVNVTVQATVGGVAIVPTGATVIAAETRTDTTIITMLDSLVSNLNTALKAAGAAAFASHNYISGYNDITKAVISIEGIDVSDANLTEVNGTTLAVGAVAEANTNPGTLSVSSAAIIADLKDNPVYTPDYVNYGPLYTMKDAGYEVKALLRASTNLANTPTTHWDAIDLTRASSDWLKNNEFNLFSVDNTSGYWAYVVDYTNPNAISTSNVVLTPSFVYHFNSVTDATANIVNTASFSVDVTGANAATSNAKIVVDGKEIQLVNTGSTYTANLNEYEAGLVSGSDNTIALKVADGLGERYDNLALATLDYVKPAAPTVTFIDQANATFADTSTDVANYYLWANYIPDDGSNAVGPISPTDAASYNMCQSTAFASSTPYKLVAIDGTGVFGKANISDAKAFTFANTVKDATVLTHNYGDTAATALRYDTSCVATTDTTKSGVEVRAQQVGTVRMAYQHITGAVNNTTDLPVTSYYDVPTAVGTAVIQVDSLANYAGKTFYVEYNNALYTGTFPADRATADGSFSTPLNLTAVASENQKLN